MAFRAFQAVIVSIRNGLVSDKDQPAQTNLNTKVFYFFRMISVWKASSGL